MCGLVRIHPDKSIAEGIVVEGGEAKDVERVLTEERGLQEFHLCLAHCNTELFP